MRGWKSSFLKFKRAEQGTSVLELAAVLPVLTVLGYGAVEFGNMLYRHQLVTAGIRDAGRYISGLPYDPANATQTASSKTAAKNIAACGQAVSCTTAQQRLSWFAASNVDINYIARKNNVVGVDCGTIATTACLRGGDKIYSVTVSTTGLTYGPNSGSVGFLNFLHNVGALNSTSISINVSHEERVIGVR